MATERGYVYTLRARSAGRPRAAAGGARGRSGLASCIFPPAALGRAAVTYLTGVAVALGTTSKGCGISS